MTGDVLSPRWSTEDTDEQPAIQVSGNETYILPPGQAAQSVEPPATPATPATPADAPHDVLDGPSGPHDVLDGASGPHDVLSGPHEALSGPHETLAGPQETLSGPHAVLGADALHAATGDRAVDDDLPYLPLDQGYKPERDDDADAGGTRRGFLGSGWTDDADDRRGAGEREVRRRTRVLVLAGVAVVLVGAGAGWLLTGTSSDDPCGTARCASASEVSAPPQTALPEQTEEATPEPEVTDTAEPTVSETVTPTPVARRPRPTREPTARPTTSSRERRPTATPDDDATRGTRGHMNETSDGAPEDAAEAPATKEPERQETGAPTQAPPPTQQDQPAPAPSEKKGLFDILFPW
ncbi:hypothetical protein [Nonomuraea sp. NPDC001699]